MSDRPLGLRALEFRVVETRPAASHRPALPIKDLPGADHEARSDGLPIDTLVLYCVAQAGTASVHYVVDEDGSVLRRAAEDRRVRHAGAGQWRGQSALDGRSIAVGLVDPGTSGEFRVLQVAALCDLCLLLLARHPIPPRNVVGGGDIAPDRRQDPGARFDWAGLAANGVGLWPHEVPDLGITGPIRDAANLRPVRAALAEIGYRVGPEGTLDPALSGVVRAFQRHWRPEAVNGQVDDGTLLRLQAVLRLVRRGRQAGSAAAGPRNG